MRRHPLKSILIFIAVVGIGAFLINFAVQQWQPHPDWSVSEQKPIVDYNNFSKPFDITTNSWAEITFVKDNKLTMQIHASPDKNMAFFYVYEIWNVTKNSTGNGYKVKQIGSDIYRDYDNKSFYINAGESAEVIINCEPITTLSPGMYVIKVNEMYVFFELVEPVEDHSFFGIDLGEIF